jgi:hypothetical protein
MADVLADHYPNYQWHRDLSENYWTCTSLDCVFMSQSFEKAIAHQVEVLEAAGHGAPCESGRNNKRALYVLENEWGQGRINVGELQRLLRGDEPDVCDKGE